MACAGILLTLVTLAGCDTAATDITKREADVERREQAVQQRELNVDKREAAVYQRELNADKREAALDKRQGN